MVSLGIVFIRNEAANLYLRYKNSSSDLLVLPGLFTPLGKAPWVCTKVQRSCDVIRQEIPRALIHVVSEVSDLGAGSPAKRNQVVTYSTFLYPDKQMIRSHLRLVQTPEVPDVHMR